jgi:hypothetical protein
LSAGNFAGAGIGNPPGRMARLIRRTVGVSGDSFANQAPDGFLLLLNQCEKPPKLLLECNTRRQHSLESL